MAEVILAVCTILGGIAAIAFFIEKALAKRVSAPHDSRRPAAPEKLLSSETSETRHVVPSLTTIATRTRVHPSGQAERVKLGWSWPAYFFGGIWALIKRLPLTSLVIFGVSVLTGYAMRFLHISKNDQDYVFLGVGQIVGIICGAYGNIWRERALARRGFIRTSSVRRADSFVGTAARFARATWSARWSRRLLVSLTVIVVMVSAVYLVFRPSESALGALVFEVRECDRAQLNGHIEPNGYLTTVWFEWGETPSLGFRTMDQHFTENTEVYQHIVGLKQGTMYYYRMVAVNSGGQTEGRILVLRTPRCGPSPKLPA